MANGVISKVTSGMASELASRPTSDIWLNSSKVKGAKASVTSHCWRAALAICQPSVCNKPMTLGRVDAGKTGPEFVKKSVLSGNFLVSNRAVAPEPPARAAPKSVAKSTPTATNESQKPACVKAHGSASSTAAIASSQTIGHGQRRLASCRAITTASIHTVRWAGTPQPENSAYSKASASPPMAPA